MFVFSTLYYSLTYIALLYSLFFFRSQLTKHAVKLLYVYIHSRNALIKKECNQLNNKI